MEVGYSLQGQLTTHGQTKNECLLVSEYKRSKKICKSPSLVRVGGDNSRLDVCATVRNRYT